MQLAYLQKFNAALLVHQIVQMKYCSYIHSIYFNQITLVVHTSKKSKIHTDEKLAAQWQLQHLFSAGLITCIESSKHRCVGAHTLKVVTKAAEVASKSGPP
jgi:hypothetical protein